MKRLIIIAILLIASCSWGADYKMVVASAKELGATANEPTIFHDVYPLKSGEDISPTYGIPAPSVLLCEIVVDNVTANQILTDGSYLVLSSRVIQTGGPGAEPVTPDPTLTIDPEQVLDEEAAGSIAVGLSNYGFLLDADGKVIPPSPPCVDTPLKCSQIQQAATVLSASVMASEKAGKTRAQVTQELIETMKGLPRAEQ